MHVMLCQTYTKEASQVINTVQLNPKIDKKPNRRFSTAFLPNRARARSSVLVDERAGSTLSSTSLPFVGVEAVAMMGA
jgi:hypothetical protein